MALGCLKDESILCNEGAKEGAGWAGPVCSHLPCTAWVAEGTSGGVREETSHSLNRMETKWKRLS